MNTTWGWGESPHVDSDVFKLYANFGRYQTRNIKFINERYPEFITLNVLGFFREIQDGVEGGIEYTKNIM